MGTRTDKAVMEGKSGKRVWVIVEDEPSLRMMLSAAMMLIWNVEPLPFDDGYQAMAWLDGIEAQKQPDVMLPELALLDIRMPGPQGPEIGERLRKVPATSKIAIVMMTAYRLDPDERASIMKMASPQAMVSKPLPMLSELKETLEQAIASTRSGILSPIEFTTKPKETQQGVGLSRLPTLEELIAVPEKPQQESGTASATPPQEPPAAPKETVAVPKETQQGPGVTAPSGAQEPASAPMQARQEPGKAGPPERKDLLTALRALQQQGSGIPLSPDPGEPVPASKATRQDSSGSDSTSSRDLITALRALQQRSETAGTPTPILKGTTPPEKPRPEPDAASAQSLQHPPAAPEKPQQESGTTPLPDSQNSAKAPVRPRHGLGALGTKELPPEPDDPRKRPGLSNTSGSRSGR